MEIGVLISWVRGARASVCVLLRDVVDIKEHRREFLRGACSSLRSQTAGKWEKVVQSLAMVIGAYLDTYSIVWM